MFLLCSRWRGTPETRSSVWCTQQCPSQAPRTRQYPRLRAAYVSLRHQPPPTLQRLCGTFLTSSPNIRQSNKEIYRNRKPRPCSTVLLLDFFSICIININPTVWAFLYHCHLFCFSIFALVKIFGMSQLWKSWITEAAGIFTSLVIIISSTWAKNPVSTLIINYFFYHKKK